MAGDDANLYGVTLSLRDRRNLAPAGSRDRSISRRPCGCPDETRITELRFLVPADAERLTVRNFDAANGDARASSAPSARRRSPRRGRTNGARARSPLQPDERGQVAAITFAGGDEIPNDVTFEIRDQAGRCCRSSCRRGCGGRTQRPAAGSRRRAPRQLLLGRVRRLALDRPGRRPAELRVAVRRRRERGSGRALVHQYPGPGHLSTRRFACSTASGQVGAGAVRPLRGVRQAAAGRGRRRRPGGRAGRARRLSTAARSLAGERPIARYLWDFYDGGRAEGQSASHAFAAPGRYIVTLRVEDDSSPPCNFSTDQQIVQVNAPPVAVAGDDQRVWRPVETLSLDGQRSYDVDGEHRRLRVGPGRRHDASPAPTGRSTPTTRPAPTSRR